MSKREAVEAVCRIAGDLRVDATLTGLVEERFIPARHELSEEALVEVLTERPELVSAWELYSVDKRTGSGWALEHSSRGWTVSEPFGDGQTVRSSDAARACAVFIMRELSAVADAAR